MSLRDIWQFAPPAEVCDFETAEQIEIRLKYAGYIERQSREIDKLRRAEEAPIPETLDYETVPGLPRETRDRLKQVRPVNFGQAQRISGVRAADIAVLHIYVEKLRRARAAERTELAAN